MRKRFNVTGSCNPERHYMVDSAKRFAAVEALIDQGEYFTINRARQYGKTTTMRMIWRKLSDKYLIVDTSLEGVGDKSFEDEQTFAQLIVELIKQALIINKADSKLIDFLGASKPLNLKELSSIISDFCNMSSLPVLLMIDEVDKSSDNQLFLSFLGMLRELYLLRDKRGMDSTFHSVVLAGVYDVKNLKLRLRPDEERKYNSPWNIAADFNVDMTFHPDEIAQMLADYEADNHTGMDINAISHEIYKYTSGYPFLVSYICKTIDERLNRQWNETSIVKTVKLLAQGGSTLMDDLAKNLENYPEFREFMFLVSVNSKVYTFTLVDPMVSMGNMFSYIRNVDGHVAIHNLVFEETLYAYFCNRTMFEQGYRLSPFQLNYVRGGRLMMEHVVERFRDLIREEYRESDEAFLERQGRLLFLTFLKPVINGTGFYYVEPQTRDNRRMDLVVTYGQEEFIVELKIWRGTKYEESGRDQLAAYLHSRGLQRGYLVTFDFSKHKHDTAPQWITHNGKQLYEVII